MQTSYRLSALEVITDQDEEDDDSFSSFPGNSSSRKNNIDNMKDPYAKMKGPTASSTTADTILSGSTIGIGSPYFLQHSDSASVRSDASLGSVSVRSERSTRSSSGRKSSFSFLFRKKGKSKRKLKKEQDAESVSSASSIMGISPISYNSPYPDEDSLSNKSGLMGISAPAYSSPAMKATVSSSTRKVLLDDPTVEEDEFDDEEEEETKVDRPSPDGGVYGITPPAYKSTATDTNDVPTIIDTQNNSFLQSFLGMGSPMAQSSARKSVSPAQDRLSLSSSVNNNNNTSMQLNNSSMMSVTSSRLVPVNEDPNEGKHIDDEIAGHLIWGDPISRFVHKKTATDFQLEKKMGSGLIPQITHNEFQTGDLNSSVNRSSFNKSLIMGAMPRGKEKETDLNSSFLGFSPDAAADTSASQLPSSILEQSSLSSSMLNSSMTQNNNSSLMLSPQRNRKSSQRASSSQLAPPPPPPPADIYKIFVLILNPSARIFELVEVKYPIDTTTIGMLLDLVPIKCTNKSLGYQAHIGFCRPRGKSVTSRAITDLSMMASGSQRDGTCARIVCGEILVAIPEGFAGKECQKLSQSILKHPKLVKILSRSDPLAPVDETKNKNKGGGLSRRSSRKSLDGDEGRLGIASFSNHSPNTLCAPVAEDVDEEMEEEMAKQTEERKTKRAQRREKERRRRGFDDNASFGATSIPRSSAPLDDDEMSRDQMDTVKLQAAAAAAAAAEEVFNQKMEEVVSKLRVSDTAKFQILNEIADDLSVNSFHSAISTTLSVRSGALGLDTTMRSLGTRSDVISPIAVSPNENKVLPPVSISVINRHKELARKTQSSSGRNISLDRSKIESGDFKLQQRNFEVDQTVTEETEDTTVELSTHESTVRFAEDVDYEKLKFNAMKGIFRALTNVLIYYEDNSKRNRDRAISSIYDLKGKMTMLKLSHQVTTMLSVLFVVKNLMEKRQRRGLWAEGDEFIIRAGDSPLGKDAVMKSLIWLFVIVRGKQRQTDKSKRKKKSKSKSSRQSNRYHQESVLRRTLFSGH